MSGTSCTLLVAGYDGGEDLWEGFFTALTAQWPELDLPIVLNTESKSCSFPGLEIKTLGLYPDRVPPWGERMRETLKRIDTEYVLLMLDDFWLDAPVDDAFFRKCLGYMEDNPDVAVLSFQRTHGPNIRDGRFPRFERRPQRAEYRFNCQAAVWRRERLIKFIRPKESAWDWELSGSVRSGRYRDGFYTLIEGEKPVFSYDRGGVIYRGKWHRETIEPLCARYGLTIDFSRRGFYKEEPPAPPAPPPSFLERLRMPHRLRRIRDRLSREFLKLSPYLPEIRIKKQ